NASHELRSPLTVISGYLESLGQDPALAPEMQAPVAEMRRQAERMTAIIHDLLELSRLEETDAIVGGEPIDVAALLALLRKDTLARPVHPRDVRVRVDPGRSRATGGSGLGLAIVKHVLQRHGASLEVQSTLGSGSTFTCHFPPERIAAQLHPLSSATA